MGWWSRRLGIGVLIMGRLSYVPLLSPLEQFRSSFPPLHRPSQMPNYFTQSLHDFTPPRISLCTRPLTLSTTP